MVVGCRDDGLHCLTLVRAGLDHTGPRRSGLTRTRAVAQAEAEPEPTEDAVAIDERRLAALRRVSLLRSGDGST